MVSPGFSGYSPLSASVVPAPDKHVDAFLEVAVMVRAARRLAGPGHRDLHQPQGHACAPFSPETISSDLRPGSPRSSLPPA